LLARSFLHQFLAENHRSSLKGFSPQAEKLIQEYPWPGNVRELRSRVKRAVVMADGPMIAPEDLDLSMGTSLQTLKDAREEAEQRVVNDALTRQRGNISKAARELDITRPTMHDLMKKYHLTKEMFK
jgi:two-component system NtrC family response regulator